MNSSDAGLRHSRLGITSTLIGGGLPLLVLLLLVLSLNSGNVSKQLQDAFAVAFIVVGIVALPLHLLGLIFGLIGSRAKDQKRAFSVAGIVLNAVFGLIGFAILCFVLGSSSLFAFR